MILGIDEVGRGPWAGPLVIGAVVLGSTEIDGLTDSKKLSMKRRELLCDEIYSKASAVGLGWVSAAEIDEIGLSTSLALATRRAVEQITQPYHEIIIDGTINFLRDTAKGPYVTTLKKADLLIPSVSAASIVAKVARDRYMAEQGKLYPEYGFDAHVGYGTAAHRAAIEMYGVTPLHRLSFAPLQKYRTSSKSEPVSGKDTYWHTTEAGQRGEAAVVSFLEISGHTILAKNWKTKYCEIDIISRLESTIYFTEVKYRRTHKQGDGLAAITPSKVRQMKFATTVYMQRYGLNASNLRLAVASVTGENYAVETWFALD